MRTQNEPNAQRRWKRTPNETTHRNDKPTVRRGSRSVSARPRRLSGRELLELPAAEAARVMKRATLLASEDYKPGGELRIFEANDPILDD